MAFDRPCGTKDSSAKKTSRDKVFEQLPSRSHLDDVSTSGALRRPLARPTRSSRHIHSRPPSEAHTRRMRGPDSSKRATSAVTGRCAERPRLTRTCLRSVGDVS